MKFSIKSFIAISEIFIWLVPLLFVILEGPGSSVLLGIAGIIGFILVGPRYIVEKHAIFLLVSFIYIIISLFFHDEAETYQYWNVILGLIYAIPAGIQIARITQKNNSESVIFGYILFAGILCLGAMALLATVNIDSIIKSQGGKTLRLGVEGTFTFLYIFKSSNVIIGVVPMTIPAMVLAPALFFLRTKLAVKVLGLLVMLLALHVNYAVLTRTGLVSTTIATIIALIVILFNCKATRKTVIKKVVISGVILLLAVCALIPQLDNISALADRLQSAGDDSRLNVWSQAVGLLSTHPFGGATSEMTEALWAHNLFLDIGLTAGWLGLLLFTIQIYILLSYWIKAIKVPNLFSDPFLVTLFTLSLGVFIAGQINPPQLSFLIIITLCAFYGHEKVQAKRGTLIKNKKINKNNISILKKVNQINNLP